VTVTDAVQWLNSRKQVFNGNDKTSYSSPRRNTALAL